MANLSCQKKYAAVKEQNAVRQNAKTSAGAEKSCGNVFRDLGVRNPELALLKAELALEIQRAIDRKGFTQREAGEIMGIPAVKVSSIVCGRLQGYTLDRLFTYLNRLDVDIQVKMKPKPKRRDEAEITTVHA